MLSTRSSAASVVIGLAGMLSAGPAHGYCRTSTTSSSDVDGHVCTPPQKDDSGLPVYWGMPRVTYSLQKDASADVSLDAFRPVVRAAFDTWMAVDCGGEPPRIEVIEAEDAVCAKQEYNKELANANIVFFQDQGWEGKQGQLALTTVTFQKSTGQIYDADMALNSADFLFATDGSPNAFDLLSVLTHEAGHFLGLAHSPVAGATMTPTYTAPSSELDLRDLTQDDIDGICAIYPPGPVADECDATPRHGFSTLCGDDQPGPVADEPPDDRCCCVGGDECVDGICVAGPGGCTCTTAPSPGTPWPSALCLAAVATALARRRSRSGPSKTC